MRNGLLNRFLNNTESFSCYQVHPFMPCAGPIKGTLANSVHPDQTPQNAVSDQGVHCLHYIQEFQKHGNKKLPDTLLLEMELFKQTE